MRCVPPLAGDDAALHLGQAERRVRRGEPDVGREQQRHAAADAVAVHRGDDRLPDFEPAIEDLVLLGQPEAGSAEFGRPTNDLRSAPALKEMSPAPVTMAHAHFGIVAHPRPRGRKRCVVLRVHRVAAARDG